MKMLRLFFMLLFAVTFYSCSESVDELQDTEIDLFQESAEFKSLTEIRCQQRVTTLLALKKFRAEGRAKTADFTNEEKANFRNELQKFRLAMISNSELPIEEQRTLSDLESEILSKRSLAYRQALKEAMGRDDKSSLALTQAYLSFHQKYPEVDSEKLSSHLKAHIKNCK